LIALAPRVSTKLRSISDPRPAGNRKIGFLGGIDEHQCHLRKPVHLITLAALGVGTNSKRSRSRSGLASNGLEIEIMAATGIDRSSVASLVAKLVHMRLVSRRKRASDNRAYAVHLTSDGEAALRRNLAIAARVDADLLSPLSRKEREGLLRLLKTLATPAARKN
jgi:DNA-binding MarR family transcriptional regulator